MRYILILLPLFYIGVGNALAGEVSSYKVAMVLWRGMTDAERGFMDYLKSRKFTVEFIIKNCNKDKACLPKVVDELRELKPDLIYAFGTSATLGLVGSEAEHSRQQHITDIPVVFNIVSNPTGAGIVTSMSSSGRNVTGVSHAVPLLIQLNVIRKLVTLKRLGVIYNQGEKNSLLAIGALRKLAAENDFDLVESAIAQKKTPQSSLTSLKEGISALLRQRPDMVYLPSDSFLIANAEQVSTQMKETGIPLFSATEGPIRQNGAFMGVVATYYSAGKFAGFKAEQILTKKKSAQQIPVETLRNFTVLVNMKTARQIDLYPPVPLMAIAEVIPQ